jgi:CBS domain-containing protein
MIAKDIMNRDVVTIRDSACVREVIRTLADQQISGAPVVDEQGVLIGVVSMADCIQETERGGAVRSRGLSFHRDLWWDLEDDHCEKSVMVLDESLKASDLMTPEPFTVSEVTPVPEVVELMIAKRIHRVVVTTNEAISGIITTVDVMRALSAELAQVAGKM